MPPIWAPAFAGEVGWKETLSNKIKLRSQCKAYSLVARVRAANRTHFA
jgi:hypothetical protein